MNRRSIPILFAIVLAAVLPLRLEAQSYAETVWTQLNRAYQQVNSDGYNTRNYIIGRMNDGANDSWTFNLPGNSTYRIVGVCDNDCDDLDITVLEGERKVAEDVLDDDVPIVNFTTKGDTRFTVRVTMANCKSEPCFFGIAVFYK